MLAEGVLQSERPHTGAAQQAAVPALSRFTISHTCPGEEASWGRGSLTGVPKVANHNDLGGHLVQAGQEAFPSRCRRTANCIYSTRPQQGRVRQRRLGVARLAASDNAPHRTAISTAQFMTAARNAQRFRRLRTSRPGLNRVLLRLPHGKFPKQPTQATSKPNSTGRS